MFYRYIFTDGYTCFVKGMSKTELKSEERKHGKIIKKVIGFRARHGLNCIKQPIPCYIKFSVTVILFFKTFDVGTYLIRCLYKPFSIVVIIVIKNLFVVFPQIQRKLIN